MLSPPITDSYILPCAQPCSPAHAAGDGGGRLRHNQAQHVRQQECQSEVEDFARRSVQVPFLTSFVVREYGMRTQK